MKLFFPVRLYMGMVAYSVKFQRPCLKKQVAGW